MIIINIVYMAHRVVLYLVKITFSNVECEDGIKFAVILPCLSLNIIATISITQCHFVTMLPRVFFSRKETDILQELMTSLTATFSYQRSLKQKRIDLESITTIILYLEKSQNRELLINCSQGMQKLST